MQLLCVLATQPGKVFSKQELLAQVWPKRVIVDGGLKRAISALRRVLGDSAETPLYIETIPRVGYRLLADVRPCAKPAVGSRTHLRNGLRVWLLF